jgi:hypothetical protein
MDDRKARLQRLVYPGQTFTYLYDFGDSWRHTITVEQVETRAEQISSAYILDGKRACPPDDVGGTGGYEEFLETILHQKESREARDYLNWVDCDFNPEAFDRRTANITLLRMAWNGWGEK